MVITQATLFPRHYTIRHPRKVCLTGTIKQMKDYQLLGCMYGLF